MSATLATRKVDQDDTLAKKLSRGDVDPGEDALVPVPADPVTFHVLADIFPILPEDRLHEFAQDIKDHGLLDPIVLHEGQILDGRCRFLACKTAGVQPKFQSYIGNDPLGFVVSRNLHRRHLNESQRAMAAAKAANLKLGANQYSQGMPIGTAANLMNISCRSVARAREVLAHGDAELVVAVESGELALSAAAALANDNAAPSDSAHCIDPLTASANQDSTAAEEPSPSASTIAEAASAQAGSPSLEGPSLDKVTWTGGFKLPMPGVTFLVGGRRAAVMEVAVKIGATVSAAGVWPDHSHAGIGEVIWLSCQSEVQTILRHQFEAAAAEFECGQAYRVNARFLEADNDDCGLPIRDFSKDIRRIYREFAQGRPAKVVVLDHFSEYFQSCDIVETIRRFRSATADLQELAIKHGAAVVLPCVLPARDDEKVTKAVSAFRSLQGVNTVFFIKRDAKPSRGSVHRVTESVDLDVPGFPFQLRNCNGVPAVVWDSLSSGSRMR